MIEIPKLVVILVVAFLVWYAIRWVNGTQSAPPRPRPPRRPQAGSQAGPSPRQQRAVEDLVACRTCGAYVAAGAGGCGKPGCPRQQ